MGVITAKQGAYTVNPLVNLHPSTHHHLNGLRPRKGILKERSRKVVMWNANYNNLVDNIILVWASNLWFIDTTVYSTLCIRITHSYPISQCYHHCSMHKPNTSIPEDPSHFTDLLIWSATAITDQLGRCLTWPLLSLSGLLVYFVFTQGRKPSVNVFAAFCNC